MKVVKEKEGEIVKLSIDEICVNPENPRHDPVIGMNESFIMEQLLGSKKEVEYMFKLIFDIGTEGWYPQSVVTVTYDNKQDKYIAWDGNRRLTALKILKNTDIADDLKCFSFAQIQKIKEMSNRITDMNFYEIPCFVAVDLNDCAGYIRNIHTTDTAALPWNNIAIKRFENKLGRKNLFSQISEYVPKAFDNIKDDFAVARFEKIVSSEAGKKYLGIDNIDGIFTMNSYEKEQELKDKITKIVEDIDSGVVKAKTVQSAKKISEYIDNICGNDIKEVKLEEKLNGVIEPEDGLNNTEIQNKEVTENIKENKSKETAFKPITSELQQFLIDSDEFKYIKPDNRSIFMSLNIDKLNCENDRARGIRRVCYEIQQIYLKGLSEILVVGLGTLIRILLEQSCIYYLINKGMWDALRVQNNNRDLSLEKIIKEIDKRKYNIFDSTTLRCWNTFNDTSSTKDFLDLVVHQPHIATANSAMIKRIGEEGLFAVVQFFINN